MGTLKRMRERALARGEDERGATLIEYALLIALISVVCIVAITMLGHESSNKFSKFGTCWDWAGQQTNVPAECQN